MIRLPTFSPAAPTKTPPPSFVPPAVKHSPHGPRSPAWRWLRNHACRRPSLNPSRLSLFHRRQVDDAVMDRAAWWQVLRDIPPLATRAKDIHRGASRISADFYGRKGLFEPIRAILNPLCPSAAEYGVLTWCAIRIAHHVNTPYSAAEGQSGFRMARIGSKSPFLP